MMIHFISIGKKIQILCILICACFFLCSCQTSTVNQSDVLSKLNIGEYVFCVEQAFGDRHNIKVLYSLKRQDGSTIDPEVRFDSLISDAGVSFGGGVHYNLSDDGKIMWIEEEQSSGQEYKNGRLCSVTLKDLLLGEKNDLGTIDGIWSVSYRLQIDEEYTELLDHNIQITINEHDNYYYELSSIQLSALGIHMDMLIPDYDVHTLTECFSVDLIMKDGAVIDLELHHSIRGKQAPFFATGETMFKTAVALNEIHSIVICGQPVFINII